jgi:hypothetical protein
MKRCFVHLSAFALAATLTHAASAQAPAPPPAPQPQQPALPEQPLDVSISDLDTFADIYVELQEVATEYDSRMAAAESQEEAQELQMEMVEESIQTIESHGWTPERYTSVAEAINTDPNLHQEAIALIEEKS